MVKSMTGYGRTEAIIDSFSILVELRSVNHRYQETYLRIPRELSSLEDEIKKKIQEQVKRGRVDCTITMENNGRLGAGVQVDWNLVRGYYQAALEIQRELNLHGELKINDILRLPDVFTAPSLEDNEQIKDIVLHTVKEACEALSNMRIHEGKAIETDLRERIRTIDALNDQIRSAVPRVVKEYRERLLSRIDEFINGRTEIDDARILNEVAVFADKANIEEEIIRLKSHCQQFLAILSQQEPIGRKLDFLIQEMNREINTIGSKANDLNISQNVVEVKSEIEKLREQVQNIE